MRFYSTFLFLVFFSFVSYQICHAHDHNHADVHADAHSHDSSHHHDHHHKDDHHHQHDVEDHHPEFEFGHQHGHTHYHHSAIITNPFPKLTDMITTILRKSLSPLQNLSSDRAAYTASIIVSSISLVSLLLLPFSSLMSTLLLPFAAGALLSDLVNHLLPQVFISSHPKTSLTFLCGIAFFSLFDALLHRYAPHTHSHASTAAYINLAADALHNFCDGITLAAAFMSSNTAGIATTIAIVLHELPQELADFAILIRAGFSKKKALIANLICALTALLGTAFTLTASHLFENPDIFALPFAAGALLYMTFVAVLPDVIHDISKPVESINKGKQIHEKPSFPLFVGRALIALVSAAAGVWLVGIVESIHEH